METIKVRRTDTELSDVQLIVAIFTLNNKDDNISPIKDVNPDPEGDWNITIDDGFREIVIGWLGELSNIALE